MPWRIEAGGQQYVINAGSDVTVFAPDVLGNEEIRCHAGTHLGSPYLGFAEVIEGKVDTRSERYIYPVVNNYKKDLKKRGVVVTFIKKIE